MTPGRLAVIRPTSSSVAEDWVAVVEGLLLQRPDARRLGDETIALDAGEGRNVVVRFDEASLSFHGVVEYTQWYDEEHGAWDEDEGMNDPIDELVWSVGRSICVVLRWGLHTDRGVIPYVPSPCDACGAPVFDDEEACPECGVSLHQDEFGEPEELADEAAVERHAERLVRALIEHGHLELASSRSEHHVVQKLVTPMMNGRSASAIAELLLDLTPVSDLFCDDETLAKMIEATRVTR